MTSSNSIKDKILNEADKDENLRARNFLENSNQIWLVQSQ